MTTAIAVYLYLLAGGLAVLMVRHHRNGTCELLSIRNVGLLGFIIFQLMSGAYALRSGNYYAFFVSEQLWTGLEFAAMATVFLLLVLWAYRRGWIVARLARGLPTTWASPSAGGFLWIAFITTVMAVILRVVVQIPVISIVTRDVGTGLAAAACGLVGWVWGRRLLNPALIVYGVVMVFINLCLTMYGEFGRRGVVGVGACLIWGMYYSHWRHLPTPVLLRRLAIMSIGPIVFVGLFTSIRAIADREYARTPDQQLRLIAEQGELHTALRDLDTGQGVGAVSMWLIEKYPDEIEYRHLFTIWHFIIYPIPRVLWPTKPTDIGFQLAALAVVPGVDRSPGGVNYGAGVIGTAAAEGGWYALVIYAVLVGLFLRFFDEIVRLNAHSPFVIIAVGSALGHILGLARGSVSSFAFITVMTVGGCLLYMVAVGKLVEGTDGTGGY